MYTETTHHAVDTPTITIPEIIERLGEKYRFKTLVTVTQKGKIENGIEIYCIGILMNDTLSQLEILFAGLPVMIQGGDEKILITPKR